MDKIEQLADEIRQMIEQYRSEVPTSRRTWPQSIKQRVLELRSLQVSDRKISKMTGVPVPTIYLWRRKAAKINGAVQASFIPVRARGTNDPAILKHATALTKSSPSPLDVIDVIKSAFVITLPGGLRVEGVDIDSIVELSRRLSL